MLTPTKSLHPEGSQDSLGKLLGDLVMHLSALVKGEVALVRSEVRDKIDSYCSAILITAVGMGFALLASMALLTSAIVALATYVGFAMSALICGALLAVPFPGKRAALAAKDSAIFRFEIFRLVEPAA